MQLGRRDCECVRMNISWYTAGCVRVCLCDCVCVCVCVCD